jgi:hypothetical protein
MVPNCSNLLPWFEVGLFCKFWAKPGAMAATKKAVEANKLFTWFDLQGFITNVEVNKNKEIPPNGGNIGLRDYPSGEWSH